MTACYWCGRRGRSWFLGRLFTVRGRDLCRSRRRCFDGRDVDAVYPIAGPQPWGVR
jgi:hypothetical protein